MGFWLETLLYGAVVLLFWSNLAVFFKGTTAPKTKSMLSAAILVFTLATAHLLITAILVLPPILVAFMISLDSIPWQHMYSLVIAELALRLFQIIAGNAVSLYRLWLGWNQSIGVAIVPALLLLASIACACYSIAVEARFYSPYPSVLNTIYYDNTVVTARNVLIAFEIIVTVQAVITSALIAIRLWRANKTASKYSSGRLSSLTSIVRLIGESAAFYAATLLTMVLLWGLAPAVVYEIFKMLIPAIVGLTFCGPSSSSGAYSSDVQLAGRGEQAGIIASKCVPSVTTADGLLEHDIEAGRMNGARNKEM